MKNKGADQTARMRWLICSFVVRIWPKQVFSWRGSALMLIWTASSEFGTYSLCEQRWFRRACAFAQSRQNLRYSLIQAVSQEEPSDRKPDPWPLWMAGHAQLKFVMTECSKTQIRLTGLICKLFYEYFSRRLEVTAVMRQTFFWLQYWSHKCLQTKLHVLAY